MTAFTLINGGEVVEGILPLVVQWGRSWRPNFIRVPPQKHGQMAPGSNLDQNFGVW